MEEDGAAFALFELSEQDDTVDPELELELQSLRDLSLERALLEQELSSSESRSEHAFLTTGGILARFLTGST